MVMNRRQVLTGLGVAALGMAAAGKARAQAWPSRPIKLVIPFAPGGGADTTGRIVAEALGKELGQTIVVENRGGAGGNVGAAAVANAPADGYTLLYGTPGPLITNPILMSDMPYDAQKDFAPVSLLTRGTYLLAANASLPVKNLADLIRLGKEKPGSLTFSSSGIGAGSHLAGELLAVQAGLQLVHVPYRGSGPSIQDVAAGRVSFTIDTPAIMVPLIDAGKLRPIAVSAAARTKEMPDIPTIGETVPGFDVTVVNYVVARAGTPQPIIDRLNAAINTVLRNPEVMRRVAQAGAGDASGSTPEELGQILKSESDKWRAVIQRANIRID
ncbi:Bug family tripartite tricarboxylate transporter substrate binding protein [Roseomonas marmotae]|uniref:Tripartite tricarboxylate transporter substrate binding protein n=1 Tax=Roseomonas marmotae TaxID=2768161 RepID=A0ABS3K8N2_9PROT|nr:tripartite tricarboxylate transporter substrate binding protein [Roseomonas marmotae]MBO1073819.1 tripartite tricarboxylate transporter substrate binding protein [Roseomonas marmotae]QTI78551.1 tripartite tricarboxylate transporter substrate binding protein [Roseomonas marmotae]